MILDRDTKTAILTLREFNELPEYSCSLPTGTRKGRTWKRAGYKNGYGRGGPPVRWDVGQYGERCDREGRPDPNGTEIMIHWYKIVKITGIRAKTAPAHYITRRVVPRQLHAAWAH